MENCRNISTFVSQTTGGREVALHELATVGLDLQRFRPRRIGLILGVLAGAFLAVGFPMSNLNRLGLAPD